MRGGERRGPAVAKREIRDLVPGQRSRSSSVDLPDICSINRNLRARI